MTYLSNPVVLIGPTSASTTDLTGFVTMATVNRAFDPLEDTTFGDVAHKFREGLQNNTCSLTVFASYAAGESYETLEALVGTKLFIRVSPEAGTNSPTNPGFELSGTFLPSLPIINASLGELSVYEIELQGGAFTSLES